jgi:hypothetical protein
VDQLLLLRAEIMEGDLRPLYLAHLAIAFDCNHDPEEMKEPPVPAGLKQLTDAQRALAELYGLDENLIAAAARQSPSLPAHGDTDNPYAEWLHHQPQSTKDMWLARLMAEPRSTVRSDILAEFKNDRRAPSWPTIRTDRTIAELQSAAEEIQREPKRKATDGGTRKRAKRARALSTGSPHTPEKESPAAAEGTTAKSNIPRSHVGSRPAEKGR